MASLTTCGRFRFGFGLALARFGVAIGGFAAAFGFENGRLLLALGGENGRLAHTFGFENVGALLALGLHLARHAVDDVARRRDVLDLDARDLEAPGMRRLVDHGEQARIDRVALREQLVEIHAAHDGTDVGHDEIEDGEPEIADFVGGLGRIEHLIEDDAVDRHHRIVLGDDFLARHVEHRLHHVDLGADAVDERRDDAETGHQAVRIAPETLDRVDMALRDDLDRLDEEEDREKQNSDDEICAAEHGRVSSLYAPESSRRRISSRIKHTPETHPAPPGFFTHGEADSSAGDLDETLFVPDLAFRPQGAHRHP